MTSKIIELLNKVYSYNAVFEIRFIKFVIVGAIGVLANLIIMIMSQEIIFSKITSVSLRLNLSLFLSITVVTFINFILNRNWTWLDQKNIHLHSVRVLFFKYFLACWLGIVIQFGLTNLLSIFTRYLVANFVAVVIGSLFNFIMINFWLYRRMGDGVVNSTKSQ